MWHKTYMYKGAQWSFFHSVIKSSFGGYVVAGVTYPVYHGLAWIVKVDEHGNVEGEITFPPEFGINNNSFSIIESNDGDYVFTETKNGPNGAGNVWLAKIAASFIPEFSSWIILLLCVIFTIAVFYTKKKLTRDN